MKLKFKQQHYQEDAAKSVVKCFEGQPIGNRKDIINEREYIINEGTIWEEVIKDEFISLGNKKIELSNEELRKNIREVQKQNNLEFTDNQGLKDYSIEMETGTGKTYTYIKTMYELNKAYGWNKFIVMVPSIAIREGVLKSFQITEEHFQSIYNKKIRYFVYNSNNVSNISNIRFFAEDVNIQVMIINYQAFNTRSKANRRIYEELDELQSRRPIDVIKSTNPILIIDEPQKMGKTENLLDEFNPLFILRYSATHKEQFKYNMIYRLDAVDAYNQKLVKKINVKGIEILHNKSEDTYLYLEGVEVSAKYPIAKIEIEVKSKNGVKKSMKKLKVGSNLYEESGGLVAYKGYVISEIDARNQSYDKVTFTNGKEITTGQVLGDAEENYMARIQIRETIKSHFEKEREYCKKGIKVLSLFFIDEVAKYKIYDESRNAYNGEYAKIFEEEYNNVYNEFYNFIDEDYKQYLDSLNDKKVHSGYFSIDKKASKGLGEGEQIFIDSKIDDKAQGTSSDEDAYDLIMKDKERLLSLDEPVRFIFSHSALREGWDNPNIFQICTLKKNNSEISKRQEIGRGLRICVNKNGDRMDYKELEEDFFAINNLTVIASESYESFAKSLQNEILQSLSRKRSVMSDEEFIIPIENSMKTNLSILQPNENFKKEEFQELWDKINVKTRYEVNFDSEELIEKSIDKLNEDLRISQLRVKITEGEQKDKIDVNMLAQNETMETTKTRNRVYREFIPVNTKYDLIGSISKETGLTRHTIIEILSKIRIDIFEQYKYNPEEFIRRASNLINEQKALTIIDGITYTKTDKKYDNNIFTIKNANGRLGDNAIEVKKHIYDYLITDSKVELEFAKKLECSEEVAVYAKLPNGFKIPTPVGNYNPDWAIVFNNKDFKNVFFIAETKGTVVSSELREVERAKKLCAKKHFEAICGNDVKYDVVDSYETLLDLVTSRN